MNESQSRPDDFSYFLDRLIHDLREPLRSIHSFSELLAETPPGPASDRVREEIVSGAVRMRTLLDALAGYALAMRPPEGSSSLQLAFNMTLISLDRQIQDSGAVVSGEELPRVALSLERSSQILENLIGNSLRFRGERAPRVKVSAEKGDAGWWQVRLEDNGIGMEPQECETVFRPFLRLHGRKYPGAGLGLTAVKGIVENLGGTIRIESKPGEGCVCLFTLPAAEES